MIGIKTFLCVFLLASFQASDFKQISVTTISADEAKLYELIMDYRKSKGLESIPLSNSLTVVAQTHCKDLAENKPDLSEDCNAHSWSDVGDWTSCCYTPDHAQANCMWDKPGELSSYPGRGFEIAVGSSEPAFDTFVMTPEYAIDSWKKSVHHNNVLINEAIWKSSKWNAIGVGIKKGFACVWFGKKIDPEGAPK